MKKISFLRKYQNIGILILLWVLLILSESLTKNDNLSSFDSLTLNNGWDIQINNEKYEDIDLNNFSFEVANRGDKVIYTTTIPECDVDLPSLVMNAIHSTIDVYIGNDLVYSYGHDIAREQKLIGYGHMNIPLPTNLSNKKLTIELKVTENQAFTSIVPPSIIDGTRYDRQILYTNRLPLFINIFLVVFGILFGIITFITLSSKSDILRLFYLSMFSLCIGLWSFCTYNLMIIFTDSIRIKSIVEYSALYLAPLFILLYFYDDIKRLTSKLLKIEFKILIYTQSFFVFVTFLGQITNLFHFPGMLIFQHIIMALCMITFIQYILYSFIHRKENKFNLLLTTGTIIMVFCVIFDLSKFNISKYLSSFNPEEYQGIICTGTLTFVIAMFLDFVLTITKHLHAQVEKETYKKLALTDSLTGLANRRQIELQTEEITTSNSDYIVIQFDLNNLKTTNDSLGHEEGDRFISTFAQIIDDVFSEYGTAARTGGDEFVVLIRETRKCDLKHLFNIMNNKISIVNRDNPTWCMSTAYGVCDSNDSNVHSINDALNIADKRMYINKAEMKKQKSN